MNNRPYKLNLSFFVGADAHIRPFWFAQLLRVVETARHGEDPISHIYKNFIFA